jgi:hypothetical protein
MPSTIQVTLVFVVFWTAAVNCWEASGRILAVLGLIVTVTVGAGLTLPLLVAVPPAVLRELTDDPDPQPQESMANKRARNIGTSRFILGNGDPPETPKGHIA